MAGQSRGSLPPRAGQRGQDALPRNAGQDAGGTTKAAAPINLFNLPMILHGRDAHAAWTKCQRNTAVAVTERVSLYFSLGIRMNPLIEKPR